MGPELRRPRPRSQYRTISTQLLDVFLEEANELQPKISKTLRDWRQQPDAEGMSQSLQRLLHT